MIMVWGIWRHERNKVTFKKGINASLLRKYFNKSR